MIKHKVAMLGQFAVGKTSLVQRFVTGMFSDRYQTTVGVRIDQRDTQVDGEAVSLMLWDLQGEDEVHSVPFLHLRGAAGFFVVADGTRPQTLDTALRLRGEALDVLGDVPSILLLNKHDLVDEWQLDRGRLDALRGSGLAVAETSAKTGDGVARAFDELTRRILA